MLEKVYTSSKILFPETKHSSIQEEVYIKPVSDLGKRDKKY